MTYLLIVLVGVVLGAFINWAVYSWAWFPRAISPWSPPDDRALPRRATDRIPVLGWLGLRREADIHGRIFWLRPMLIELLFGPMLAGLFWWEVIQLGLLPVGAADAMPAAMLPIARQWMLIMYLGHALMMTLLMIATFIDFDEQTIPDAVTVTGTLLALALHVIAALMMPQIGAPLCLPWATEGGLAAVMFPSPAPVEAKWISPMGLVVGEAIFAVWCFALANRRWIMRKGLAKAIQFFAAGLLKYETMLLGRFRIKVWTLLVAIWMAGSVAIAAVYFGLSESAWLALLSGLVGVGLGGGQIWAVRVFAKLGLGKEAMGFGDVTLMAMVGAFIGWQAALFVFFLAPFTAIVIVLASWLLTGNRMLPFGPYLAAAAMLTVVFWDRIWNQWGAGVFILGPLIGAVLMFALVAMCALLFLFRVVEQRFFGT
ncbi:Type IV leader peptidase family protein [Rosistilla carotiformis]|uniref:Type IV leader peptidase family protein n=1 Tax=Rosistilla carotiformis TaxID=2528017 RepID=A0A518JXV8_9BACT|nr:A24 family peptidase [Rosistilla carotiformis]QDV70374.1 Type IV leader peptidase family protein [Rosistilla carotiformis]